MNNDNNLKFLSRQPISLNVTNLFIRNFCPIWKILVASATQQPSSPHNNLLEHMRQNMPDYPQFFIITCVNQD